MVSPQKPHVAIFAFPFGTHAAPLLSLSRYLAASAPDVTFSFFSTPESNASLTSTVAAWGRLPNFRIYDVWNGAPADHFPVGGSQKEGIEMFLKATPGNFEEALQRAVRERGEATCLLSDAFLWFAGKMAEEMGVPWVALWTSGAVSVAAHFHTDLLRRTLGTGADALRRQHEALDFLPSFPAALRVGDLPEGVVFGALDSLFALLLYRMAQSLPRAAVVIINTIEALDSTVLSDLNTHFRSCLPVGPLSLFSPPPPMPDTHGCLAWLDGFRHNPTSVAYVSFGSFMIPPPAELTALAAGIEVSGIPFLWSLKEKAWEGLPSGFLERIKGRGLVVPWAPQIEVLGHAAVGVFLTHCGWNSVMESITGGVPMICRPFLGDQRLNGRMMSDVWKIGVGVEGGVLTEEGVAASVDLVLRKDEGKRMRERVVSLRQRAKQAVEDGGSSRMGMDALVEIITRG